jgi:hypothetical protein
MKKVSVKLNVCSVFINVLIVLMDLLALLVKIRFLECSLLFVNVKNNSLIKVLNLYANPVYNSAKPVRII